MTLAIAIRRDTRITLAADLCVSAGITQFLTATKIFPLGKHIFAAGAGDASAINKLMKIPQITMDVRKFDLATCYEAVVNTAFGEDGESDPGCEFLVVTPIHIFRGDSSGCLDEVVGDDMTIGSGGPFATGYLKDRRWRIPTLLTKMFDAAAKECAGVSKEYTYVTLPAPDSLVRRKKKG